MKRKTLIWQKGSTPKELHYLLETLSEEYPISEAGKGILLNFQKREKGHFVKRQKDEVIIGYDKISTAARGIGTILSGLPEDGHEISEDSSFDTFGVMLDCSRNAVLKVEHLKKWLRRLALFGYNMVMLYTKDTYELPGEDYFGYLRGRYSLDELREIDDYAGKLGIEMIGCIQTLGHLEPVLRWSAYDHIKDTEHILLTTEEKSYQLIDKMLDFFSSAFRSRRIHVGMDETFGLGLGRYLVLNGYKRGFDIFNEHLEKVVSKCEARRLKPMIWSDMYFRMGSKTQDYYDQECVIPEDVKGKIPRHVQLVYWDYYHKEEAFYRDWIKRHRELGFSPLVASGIWTWYRLWYNHKSTKDTVTPCIDACLKENIKEIFFTIWGNDGVSFDLDSALAGLCYVAERIYTGGSEPDKNILEKRFEAICGGDYEAHLTASALSDIDDNISGVNILWDDPLLGIYWKNQNEFDNNFWQNAFERYSQIEKKLESYTSGGAGDISHARLIAEVLKNKIDLKLKLDQAYFNRDMQALKEVKKLIPVVIKKIDFLLISLRNHWYARYKTFGFEFIQVRLGGQKERFKELAQRLDELISGKVDSISELEEKASYSTISDDYMRLATGSYFI